MSVQNLMTPGDFVIRKNKKQNRTLLTPAYFAKLYISVSKPGEKEEEYIPKMVKPCEKCENVRWIKEHTVVQTSCFCSEIIPSNYLSITPSTDDIYKEMSVESDLPW